MATKTGNMRFPRQVGACWTVCRRGINGQLTVINGAGRVRDQIIFTTSNFQNLTLRQLVLG